MPIVGIIRLDMLTRVGSLYLRRYCQELVFLLMQPYGVQ